MRTAALVLALVAAVALLARGATAAVPLLHSQATTAAKESAYLRHARASSSPLQHLFNLSDVLDPDNKYASPGPYRTRLVRLRKWQTAWYGFDGAVVACPVIPEGTPAAAAAAAAAAGRDGGSDGAPGVVWSHGMYGDCLGDTGVQAVSINVYSTLVDGTPLRGEEKGHWLPELLEHLASWGIVTICPAVDRGPSLRGAKQGVEAAKLLTELQPCAHHHHDSKPKKIYVNNNINQKWDSSHHHGGGGEGDGDGGGVEVAGDKIGIGGNSMGGGRAVRGAAMAPNVFNAVVALHVFAGGGHHRPVTAPLMIVSGTEDNVAPSRDIRRIYNLATGPKMMGFAVGANHLTAVPRFWFGPMTAFFLTHLAGDEEAETYSWGDEGLEKSERIIGGDHDCGGWRSVSSDVCVAAEEK